MHYFKLLSWLLQQNKFISKAHWAVSFCPSLSTIYTSIDSIGYTGVHLILHCLETGTVCTVSSSIITDSKMLIPLHMLAVRAVPLRQGSWVLPDMRQDSTANASLHALWNIFLVGWVFGCSHGFPFLLYETHRNTSCLTLSIPYRSQC